MIIASASQSYCFGYFGTCLALWLCLNSFVFNMKALVGSFNQEKWKPMDRLLLYTVNVSVKMQEIVHWSDKTKHVTAWIICRPYQHIFKQNNAILCRKKYLAVLKNIWDFRPGRYISLMPVIPTQEQTLFDDIPARTPYWLYHSNIYKYRRQHKILILLATQVPPSWPVTSSAVTIKLSGGERSAALKRS